MRSSSLSRGMRQRISFILTTLHNPAIILLDEPFTGLDPANMTLMKRHLREFKAQNKTIILSTHILQFAANLCDEILFINEGQIVHSEKNLPKKYLMKCSLKKIL
ncbi:AAA family ATPase [Bacillus sp. B6(2022)]|nr:AAA family ATPase [Bacillus sp. B6(2022)]